MKRRFLESMLCALAVAVTGMAVWCVQPCANRSSVRFRCGLLGRVNNPYLDGSDRTFQRCTWHLGIGTRTWGETYGVKVRRIYVSMEVKHVNLRLTPKEAREDE
jgi:hypothetical protein